MCPECNRADRRRQVQEEQLQEEAGHGIDPSTEANGGAEGLALDPGARQVPVPPPPPLQVQPPQRPRLQQRVQPQP